MMDAAPLRLQRGPMLVAALMAVVLLLSAGWAGARACEMGGPSPCACPCGSEATEAMPRDAAQRPNCCASADPTDAVAASVVGESFKPWAPNARVSSAPRTRVSALRSGLGLPGEGAGTGPPRMLPVFLRHQALLL